MPSPIDFAGTIQPPAVLSPIPGGMTFQDAAPMICGVCDNGIDEDDPRVMVRLNEATKIIMDHMIPVGGMASASIIASGTFVFLPPTMENAIEAHPVDPKTMVRGSTDITQAWYEIVSSSLYIDPNQAHDMPMVDQGLWDASTFWGPNYKGMLFRVYQYPGLQPDNAGVVVTGKKRYVPVTSNKDFLIVQNIEAIKLIILSIERYENNDIDGGMKYRQEGFKQLEEEVKNHLMDPRNYMLRKSNYQDDTVNFPTGSLGYVRANIALDIDEAMKTGKIDLTWSINQIERRIMEKGIYKGCIIQFQAQVVGGIVYMPINVETVLAAAFGGVPIPIRSEFFQFLDNGPGFNPCYNMLIDQGTAFLPNSTFQRRKYQLVADCTTSDTLNTICKLKWMYKQPTDQMVIQNYEAIRLFMTAKFLEEKEDWKNAQANKMEAFEILDKELNEYLRGLRHTIHVQNYGFGLNDVSSCPL